MKKIMMGTSALALASSIAGAAQAVTWDLTWRGYYEASVAYRSTDNNNSGGFGLTDDEEGVDVLTDSELQFRPSIVLDNGLKFGVNIEIETDALVDQNVDDTYAYVEGPFGEIRLGHTNAAGAEMQGSAPHVDWIGASSGSLAGYLDIPEFAGTYVQPGAGDAAKIAYFTPRFAGFQLGASYAHDDNGSKDSPTAVNGFENLYSVGANYKNRFGAFGLNMNASYSNASQIVGDADHEHYAGSMTVSYAGFAVGGSYAKNDNETYAPGSSFYGSNAEHTFYDFGVAYSTGPWGVSFQYSHGESDEANIDAETDQYLAAVNYQIGPGVLLGAYAGYADADLAGANSDVDGYLVGTGFKLNF